MVVQVLQIFKVLLGQEHLNIGHQDVHHFNFMQFYKISNKLAFARSNRTLGNKRSNQAETKVLDLKIQNDKVGNIFGIFVIKILTRLMKLKNFSHLLKSFLSLKSLSSLS